VNAAVWWRRWWPALAAVAVLVSWGCGKAGWERSLGERSERLRFGAHRSFVPVGEKLGQGAALALLSGFRGFVADCLWVDAHMDFGKKEWFKMRGKLELACLLQPRSMLFWDNAAWHLAWNISHAILYEPGEMRQARRVQLARQWAEAGRVLLERGTANVPERYDLWFSLGWLCDQRLKDYPAAIEAYRKAASFPDAPPHVSRLLAYRLRDEGRLAEAYGQWRGYWFACEDKTNERYFLWSRAEREIRQLENELKIPEAERVFPQTR